MATKPIPTHDELIKMTTWELRQWMEHASDELEANWDAREGWYRDGFDPEPWASVEDAAMTLIVHRGGR